ncbi:MAG: GtrA family protein [Clostridia bacterium]|nr:GtrA family protein [Clostridia bacterium]
MNKIITFFKKFIDKKTLKFLIVGVANTAVGMGIMLLLSFIFNKTVPVFAQKLVFVLGTTDYTASYIICSAINYVVGGILSYFLNKYWSFGNKEKSKMIVVKFIVTVLLCYVVSYLGAKPLMELALKNSGIADKWKEFIALIVGAGLYTVLNYFGQRFFAFAEKKEKTAKAELAATEDAEAKEDEKDTGVTEEGAAEDKAEKPSEPSENA